MAARKRPRNCRTSTWWCISGNDVILDALLLRLHTETACRRGGALALRLVDLDTRHCLVRLTEKGGTLRWQPITPTLAARLQEHAQARGAVLPTDRLLRYRNGRPISSRRYDHLWKRIGERLPWVAAQGLSTHWLRHTTLTWLERHFGYGIARAYVGHTDRGGPATTTYIKAYLHAVAAMTGEPHPLAPSTAHVRRSRSLRRPAVLAVVAAAGHAAVLTFAPATLYEVQGLAPRGGDPLIDQHLSGLVIWIPMDVVVLAVGTAVFVPAVAAPTGAGDAPSPGLEPQDRVVPLEEIKP
ncbi:tyrosine-type recombinase/integrase [Micromonospora yasonensis]|uniref:tyrosine-type recombinase/integrase n=1 Tax=Micromonospora yasonensis TaxID=1128667 RepID=UPI0022302F3B|nr:tyrosine-type recombinase/integrase [Micromonospora yasonensis]MCW3845002.1 tyrosine-type recombinase/integrase [Micromonospora yasonensis]